jgi:hypothetical protein
LVKESGGPLPNSTVLLDDYVLNYRTWFTRIASLSTEKEDFYCVVQQLSVANSAPNTIYHVVAVGFHYQLNTSSCR